MGKAAEFVARLKADLKAHADMNGDKKLTKADVELIINRAEGQFKDNPWPLVAGFCAATAVITAAVMAVLF